MDWQSRKQDLSSLELRGQGKTIKGVCMAKRFIMQIQNLIDSL